MSKLYDLLSSMCGKIKKPDWNQNDSTAPDYVKNRPFYTCDPVETVLVEERTESFFNDEGLYLGTFQSTFVATVGETYKVFWDGEAYECTCVDTSDGLAIGNLSLLGIGSDTGEPFVVLVYNGMEITIATEDTSSSHTISIIGIVAPIVKIPAKYIDKNSSGYIAIHSNDTMTQQEAENYKVAIGTKEVVFIIWNSLCVSTMSISRVTDSTGASADCIYVKSINGEEYKIVKNSEGLYDYNDREFSDFKIPGYNRNGDSSPKIYVYKNLIRITPGTVHPGVGSTDALFSVRTNGTKSKDFNVLGNGEAVTPAIILYSSTPDSTKKFRITVDDSGTLTATEVTA